jgi:phage baseplate assembly protein W
MSKSLQLVNGDLFISNRSLQTIRGKDKLFQDLSLWLRERIGTDPMTPTYGSTLDGGTINDQDVPSFIGTTLNPFLIGQIQAEVYGNIIKYQKAQLEKMKSEASIYQGKNTLDPDEVINTIDSIKTSNVGTSVVVQVTLTTLSNQALNLTLPLTNPI